MDSQAGKTKMRQTSSANIQKKEKEAQLSLTVAASSPSDQMIPKPRHRDCAYQNFHDDFGASGAEVVVTVLPVSSKLNVWTPQGFDSCVVVV